MNQLLSVGVDGVIYSAWLFTAALGLTLIYGVMKIVNVTHGSFYALGAYAAASLTGAWLARGYPPMLSYAVLLVAALLVTLVVAPLIERGILRFMYAKDEVVILLITYALFLILEDVIKLVWGVNPYFIAEPYALLGSFNVGGLAYPTYNLILVALALVSGLGLTWLLHSTRVGKLLLAVIHDPEVSRAMGINVEPLLPGDLHVRLAARRARRRLHRADGLRGAGPRRGDHRALVRGGGDRRPGQPAGRGARRGDRRHGALALGALPAGGRAVRHLLRDGDGARVPAARPVQPGRAEEDLKRDRTPLLIGIVLPPLLGGRIVPAAVGDVHRHHRLRQRPGGARPDAAAARRASCPSARRCTTASAPMPPAASAASSASATSSCRCSPGALTAGFVAFVLGFLLARYRGIFFGLLSLALSMILYGLLVKSQALGSTDGFNILPSTLFGIRPARSGCATRCSPPRPSLPCAWRLLVHRYLRTPLGPLAPAIKDNEIRVEYMGASARRAVHVMYVIAAVLAGVGGALAATTVGHIDPQMAFWTTSGEFIFITILAGTAAWSRRSPARCSTASSTPPRTTSRPIPGR